MAGKGRAEHGGGAAKWRHGWIPVNAAARAIVAARAATKAEPHVKAPRHTVTRHDAPHPTEESSSPSYDKVLPKAPVKHPFNSLDLTGLDKIDGEHTAEADAINSNPMWLDSRKAEDPRFTENCALCVQAWELRRRGYAVQAGPLTQWMGGGMQMNEIADLWRYPSGVKARFSFEDQNDTFLANLSGISETLHRTKMVKATKNWPVGARGFVGCVWKQGGGHIFGVEKQADGLHYYDPQPGRDLGQADGYFKNMAALGVMRTDDKFPTKNLENLVVPGMTEGAPYRPGRGILTSKPTPEGLAALDTLIAKVEKNGQTASAEGDDMTLQASKTIVQAYKDARGHTPNEIMALSKRNVDSYLAGGNPDQYDTRRNALRLAMAVQHPGLKEFAKTEVVAIEDQGTSPPGDLASVAAAKVTGPPLSVEDALKGANPHYGEDGYTNNCVNSVWAYEQRRRGNVIEAKPLQSWMKGQSTAIALDSMGGKRDFTMASHSGARTIVQSWPVGARGWMQVYWKGGAGSHIFAVEREADGPHYLDPQTGETVNLEDYFKRATNEVQVVRTDDLPGETPKWLQSPPVPKGGRKMTYTVKLQIEKRQTELDRINRGMESGTKDPTTWGPIAMKKAEQLDRLKAEYA